MADPALVDHGTVVRHLNRLPDAGLAALHDPQFVGRVVQAQGRHLVAWEPLPVASNGEGGDRFRRVGEVFRLPRKRRVSPGALVVEEEHQIEPLVGLLLSLLPQTENVFGRDRDGHPVVQHALLRHLWIDDLEQSGKQFGAPNILNGLSTLVFKCAECSRARGTH